MHGGADRYAGMLAGSPSYMAPEQAMGLAVSPQTDIFAIGVMLYEMLTGERPFAGASRETLLAAIATTEPPTPSVKNPKVHPDLDAVVTRCLAKAPEGRFLTARSLFETLPCDRRGPPGRRFADEPRRTRSMAPKPSTVPPPDRPRRDDAKKHMSWSWRLSASPASLWPYVANTDRFNRAIGQSGGRVHRRAEPRGRRDAHR